MARERRVLILCFGILPSNDRPGYQISVEVRVSLIIANQRSWLGLLLPSRKSDMALTACSLIFYDFRAMFVAGSAAGKPLLLLT